MRVLVLHKRDITGNKVGRSATASSYDVHQSFIDEMGNLQRHRLGCLVVESQFIGQSGIRIGADIIRCPRCQLPKVGQHLLSTKRTIQSNREYWISTDTGKEGIECLSAQRPSCGIADGDAEHDRKLAMLLLHHLQGGMNSSLGIKRVENGLNEQHISSAFYQSFNLLGIGFQQLVIGKFTTSRVADIGRHGARPVGRSDTASHKTRMLRCRIAVSHHSGKSCPLLVDCFN